MVEKLFRFVHMIAHVFGTHKFSFCGVVFGYHIEEHIVKVL